MALVKKNIDLLNGNILTSLSELALPIMASSFLSTAYNITDMAWIGMLGSKAVAGVGVGGMYVWLSQGLSSLARMGGQVNMAHSLGRGDQKAAAGFAQAALQLTILFSLFVTLISILFTNPLLQFFALNDAETYNSARIYMRITCGLILFSFLSQVLTGLFTAQGDSKTPLKANFFGLILNMILDPLLVLGVGPFPRLEVVGAAVATVTAQIIVLLILVTEILRDHGEANVLHKIRLLSRPDIACLKGVFRIGTPTALQGSLYCIISMILTRMVSGFGDGAIAVQRVGGQIESLSWNTADGFGSALNAFMGQNYGAGKKDRIRAGIRSAVTVSVLFCLFISFVVCVFAKPLLLIFVQPHETEILKVGMSYLRIEGAFYCGIGCLFLLYGLYRAVRRPGMSVVLTVISLGTRVILAYVLSAVPSIGVTGIWAAVPIGWFLADLAGFVYYKRKLDEI